MRPAISILGGDLRQVYLARLLSEDGWKVITWGLEKGGGDGGAPLDQALAGNILLLPMPVYNREETQVANAVPTAEGALQLAMESTDRTLHGSRCLIIGYGRIGRLLADRLLALGAEVTVSARKYGDLAWIEAWGYRGVQTGALTGQLDRFDLIFNTAPALILDGTRLREAREDCVIIDLASAPGGVDLEAAKRLSRRAIPAPGLPGKVAPRTAAAAIRDSVYHILKERGELM